MEYCTVSLNAVRRTQYERVFLADINNYGPLANETAFQQQRTNGRARSDPRDEIDPTFYIL